jgi:hypothetical protein
MKLLLGKNSWGDIISPTIFLKISIIITLSLVNIYNVESIMDDIENKNSTIKAIHNHFTRITDNQVVYTLSSLMGFETKFSFFAPKVASSYYVQVAEYDSSKNQYHYRNILSDFEKESSTRVSTMFLDFHTFIKIDSSTEFFRSKAIVNQLAKSQKDSNKSIIKYINVYVLRTPMLKNYKELDEYTLIYTKKIQ